MPTLRDMIIIAQQEPNSARSQLLKGGILDGKFDTMAQQEGLDLTAFKSAFPAPPEYKQPLVGTPKAIFSVEDIQKRAESALKESEKPLWEKFYSAGAQVLGGLGDIATGLVEMPIQTVGGAIETAKEVIQNKPVTYRPGGVEGLTKALGGVGKIAMAPFELAPTVKAAVSYPFEKLNTVTQAGLAAIGIDPESQRGQDIAGAFTTGLTMALGLRKPITKGIKTGELTPTGAKAAVTETLTEAKNLYQHPIETFRNFARDVVPVPELDAAITIGIDKGIKPSTKYIKDVPARQKFFEATKNSAIDTALNKDKLEFTTPEGETITGKLPTTIAEHESAIYQGKKRAFNEYDARTKNAGEIGITITNEKVADTLERFAKGKVLKATNPATAEYALKRAAEIKPFEFSPTEAQETLQVKNRMAKTAFERGNPNEINNSVVDALEANLLREELDSAIKRLDDPRWQEFRDLYKDYRTIEDAVRDRNTVLSRKANISLLDHITNVSTVEAAWNILSGNAVVGLAKTGLLQGLKKFTQWRNSPDTAISTMFKAADRYAASLPKTEPFKPTEQKLLPAPEAGVPRTQVSSGPVMELPSRTISTIEAAEKARLKRPLGEVPLQAI